MTGQSIERVWSDTGPRGAVGRALLYPASLLYALGWRGYSALYDLGLKRPKEPHSPVVCVGNLQVGGSGKTPLTLHLAKLLREMGKQVAISASGYGSPRAESAAIAPEGELSASEWGDEPAMIRWLLPGVPLIVGRNRVRAATLCAERFPSSVLLLDDGFQHLPLRKHVSLVLLPAPGSNRLCLPAGPLREPSSGSGRATLTFPGRFVPESGPAWFMDRAGNLVSAPRSAALLTAIANPFRAAAAMERAGIALGPRLELRDHDPLTAGNLFEPVESAACVVVTAKDWVKLRERPDLDLAPPIVVMGLDMRVEPAAEFRTWLQEKLDSIEA